MQKKKNAACKSLCIFVILPDWCGKVWLYCIVSIGFELSLIVPLFLSHDQDAPTQHAPLSWGLQEQ